ncbi:MAG: hypothetical protein ACJ74J_06675 [Blastocatellia bacterium]
MTLDEAIAQWLDTTARDDSVSPADAESRALSLSRLARYFGARRPLEEVTPARLRDFLSRWFIENAGSASPCAHQQSRTVEFPDPLELSDTLAAFINWMARHTSFAGNECLAVVAELRERLPRAIAISTRLSEWLAGRGGAFGFPEFLTSFEAGGRSQYDFDTAGEAGSSEGYFRITRIDGGHIEAEEMLSEMIVAPILFPEPIVVLLEPGYIINLELVRAQDVWQVVACGFAYPPGTDV